MEIPRLDISLLVSEPYCTDVQDNFGKSLRKAFSSIGFVYLSNHGIDQTLINDVMSVSKRFFLQDENEKSQVASSEETQQGYVKPGMEIFDQNEDGIKVGIEQINSKISSLVKKFTVFSGPN